MVESDSGRGERPLPIALTNEEIVDIQTKLHRMFKEDPVVVQDDQECYHSFGSISQEMRRFERSNPRLYEDMVEMRVEIYDRGGPIVANAFQRGALYMHNFLSDRGVMRIVGDEVLEAFVDDQLEMIENDEFPLSGFAQLGESDEDVAKLFAYYQGNDWNANEDIEPAAQALFLYGAYFVYMPVRHEMDGSVTD